MAVVTVLMCLGEVTSKPWQQDLQNMENAEENVQKEEAEAEREARR